MHFARVTAAFSWALSRASPVLLALVIFFLICFLPSPEDVCSLWLLERKGGGERENHRCERETSISCLLYMPQPWIEPATCSCALTGHQTHDLSAYQTMLQPTEPHQPGPRACCFKCSADLRTNVMLAVPSQEDRTLLPEAPPVLSQHQEKVTSSEITSQSKERFPLIQCQPLSVLMDSSPWRGRMSPSTFSN